MGTGGTPSKTMAASVLRGRKGRILASILRRLETENHFSTNFVPDELITQAGPRNENVGLPWFVAFVSMDGDLRVVNAHYFAKVSEYFEVTPSVDGEPWVTIEKRKEGDGSWVVTTLGGTAELRGPHVFFESDQHPLIRGLPGFRAREPVPVVSNVLMAWTCAGDLLYVWGGVFETSTTGTVTLDLSHGRSVRFYKGRQGKKKKVWMYEFNKPGASTRDKPVAPFVFMSVF